MRCAHSVLIRSDGHHPLSEPHDLRTRGRCTGHTKLPRNAILGSSTAIDKGTNMSMSISTPSDVIPRFWHGNWMHLFGPGRSETLCRVVLDREAEAVVSAQAWDGLKWLDLSHAEARDLAESILEANRALDDPEGFGLDGSAVHPDWVASAEPDEDGPHP